MQQRIRYALTYNTIEKMKNDVEIDETYIDGKERNKHKDKKTPHSQGGNNKMSVLGIIERKGNLVLEYINKTNIKNIKPVLERYVDVINSNLYTDESTVYNSLNRKTVNHGYKDYVNGDAIQIL